MRRPPPASVAQDRDGPDLDARSLRRDDDLRRSPVRLGVRVGDRHHDPERRPLRTRREPLVAIDHPLVSVAHSSRSQSRRIRAGHLGLRHREERAHRARDEWLEPALLLLHRAELPQDLRVPRVRRLTAEHELRPERATDLLVQVRVREEAPVRSSSLRRQVRSP